MHASHQQKILDAGFIIIYGQVHATSGLRIMQKTARNSNWHIFEKDFKSKQALKNRVKELSEKSHIIDLYDTKNNLRTEDVIDEVEDANQPIQLLNAISETLIATLPLRLIGYKDGKCMVTLGDGTEVELFNLLQARLLPYETQSDQTA